MPPNHLGHYRGLMDTLLLNSLIGALGPDRVLTEPTAMAPFTGDYSSYTPEADPLAVVLPRTTEEVSVALTWANEHAIPVSIHAGGSGVAGGAVAYAGGLVISTRSMDQIVEIDPASRLAVVQPGVITAELDRAAREHGLFFAPDPASTEISTVGGNIATNAGGFRCIAYGDTAAAVAGLTVVLADGSVITTGSRTVKNSTGYNLTQLFTGSEGTLGVITEATVWLTPVPEGSCHTFLAAFDTLDDAVRAVVEINASPAFLEALELIDSGIVGFIEDFAAPGLPRPAAGLLMGQAISPSAAADIERAAQICRNNGATEVTTAADDSLLDARRLALPALQKAGQWVNGDVGVPVPALPAMITRIAEISAELGVEVRIVAHAGDGNLHPNVRRIGEVDPVADEAMDRIISAAVAYGGVITGEHGIGIAKHHELSLQFDEATLAAQRAIKSALDPKNILSPNRGI
ncbi:oxidoreductase [Corynebacterium renale]|uniref:Glycolate oxidase n=2 Tax=Corynebacterium renale TaxID=1724 RepID=A0A2A9DT48_9CORY|nr:glycolate oxidase [Corynebacterium renale]SQI25233.1 oxidoreductase [Corynebacterium renale]